MKKAIITGASGNLGQAVTNHFIKQDFFVHAFISPWDDEPNYPADIVSMYKLDLCDEELVKSNVLQVFGHDPTIDIIINCAGGFAMDSFSDTSGKAFEEMLHKNFITAFNVTIHSLGQVKNQGKPCKYIFIGSKQATKPSIGTQFVTYTLSKSLLEELSVMINEDGAELGITSHVLAPSVLDTKANRDAMPDSNFEKWVKTKELAEIIHFLTTEAGGNIRQNVIEVFNES